MFRNFITIAWRNLVRNKTYSFINIFGLALGIASTIIILMSVESELSYDQFHAKKDVLYEVWNRDINGTGNGVWCWATTCSPLAPALKETIPEIKNTSRMSWGNNSLFSYKEKTLWGTGCGVDTSFLSMFSFPLLKGDATTALNEMNSIILTETLAKKIFGNEDPMNKTVLFNNKEVFTVTGILKDLPHNTSFDFEYLVPWSYIHKINNDCPYWSCNSIQTYVELQPGASLQTVNDKIKNIVKTHEEGETEEIFLHSIKNWRLHSHFENGKMAGGEIVYVRITAIIALFILLIACINFMNLSTARSEKRAREIGIKKVVGAQRNQLIMQFLGESLFISMIAFLLSLILLQFLLPAFNTLEHSHLEINYSNPYYWIGAIAIVLFTGLFAGSYPAFYLSSFLPVKVLKGNISYSKSAIAPRKVLVVVQFIFSIGLIICTIIVERQLQYAKDRPCGYNKDALLYHWTTGTLMKNYELVKNDLINSGVAASVCLTSRSVTESGQNTKGIFWKGKSATESTVFDLISVKDGICGTMQMKLAQGRDVNLDTNPGDTDACMINESAAKIIGFKDPIGQVIYNDDSSEYHIVGVFKDFIWGSPFDKTQPMVILSDDFTTSYNGIHNSGIINVRFNSTNSTSDNLKKTEAIFKKYNPAYPFTYHFVADRYAMKFEGTETICKLAAISAILAIIISCLGLFGLAAFTASQRKKEISVRRVLGASVSDIVKLLSMDFLKLVLFAAIIAFPISWWAMQSWLQTYSYRIAINPLIFVLAGIIAIFIAFVTVSFQAIKAAKANPVKNLRSE